ncbi:FGFR1 oncogene partner 2 homolog isoform X1 [Styela clava]
MEARNTYQENLIELNKVAGHRPRSTLVLGIQQENNAIRSLQHENDELRQSLTEHQNALELIMTKYRQQMMKFTKHQNIQITENAYQAEKQYHKENMELIDKIHEMAVMRHAADVDDYNITEITKNYPDWKQKMTF